MAILVTPKALGSLEIPVGVATVFEQPAGITAVIRSITIANREPDDRLVSLYKVPPGGVPDASNALGEDLPVEGHGQYQDDAVHVLEGGGSFVVFAAEEGLTITVDGAWHEEAVGMSLDEMLAARAAKATAARGTRPAPPVDVYLRRRYRSLFP